jgi:glycosyltransferase involved in cell wall biosynthesis
MRSGLETPQTPISASSLSVRVSDDLMRVLAITNLYPNPWQPQRATFNRLQLRVLSKEHCAVRVIAPIAWSDELRARRSGKPALPAGRRVELDGMTIDHPRMFYTPGVLRGWYGHFFRRSVRGTFRRVVKEFAPTIVFAPWVYPDGWAAIQLAREAGLPVVLKAHGSDVLLLDEHPARRSGTIAAVRSADGVVAVSQDLADNIVSLGAEPERVRVVYNGLDKTLFFPGSKAAARAQLGIEGPQPQLLFVGNLVPVKGIDRLLKACANLKLQGLNCTLHLVGDGLLRRPLEYLAHTLGIADQLLWHGSMPQAALPLWYRAADLVVLPSRSEGVPNVLLEASGCGTPWVASRVGGIPEIEHLGTNKLIDSESVGELVVAIREMLNVEHADDAAPGSVEDGVLRLYKFLEETEESASRLAKCP